MNQLFDASESRSIDARAIEQLRVSGFTLMQRAADFAFACLLQRYPGVRRISVWCGKGNNAGDAYLLALLAHQYGLRVQLLAIAETTGLKGDASRAWRECKAAGLQVEDFDAQRTQVRGEVIVDGLLGTGFTGEPRQDMAAALVCLRRLPQPVLSIDIPSAVNASTGAAATQAVQADLTVSFITRKVGLYTGAGIEHAGAREFSSLGIPQHIYQEAGIRHSAFSPDDILMPQVNSHKHQQGHVVVVGGDLSMSGAVAMSAEAALRAGAGMVTVITQAQHAAAIVARRPEVMVVDADADNVGEVLRRADLFVLGPGLGRRLWGEALFDLVQSVSQSEGGNNIPVVLDADGLYWLAAKGEWHGGRLYMTPHAGEAARLLACDAASIAHDRVATARALAERWRCRGVLKGAGSVLFTSQGVEICAHGNPGMASAGMGDVLSGIAAGFLANLAEQPVEMADRCFVAAVNAHSAAADLAAGRLGYRSLLATDVIAALPELLMERST